MNSIACTSCGKENPSGARFCSRCGVSLGKSNPRPTAGDLTPGTQLRDRYIIRRPLGQGGFGKTYLAEDTGRFNELVTLKELTPTNQGTYTLQKAEELFQREAAMLHKLQHPQIPRFWEFFRHEKRLFLVQDYIDGKTYQALLDERIAVGQRFGESEIVQLLQQLLPVLSYLHSLGVIHRDIAPDNIICRASDGVPVLIDLGGVRQISLEVNTPVASLSNNSAAYSGSTCLGKIGYAPDEQLRLGIVAPHSDLYALGVTALVLMTGKQPQQLIDPQTLNWIWQQELTLSHGMSHTLSRMLAPRPSERFHSADDILQQLQALESGFSETKVMRTVAFAPQPAHSQTIPANNSGQGKLLDASVQVPEEIHGWNWGAFFLPGVWCIPNRVWIGLAAWTDCSLVTLPLTLGMTWPIVAIILGVKGNEWAWKSRRWKSIKAFKRHQRLWAIAGFLLAALFLLLLALIVVMILALGFSFSFR